MLLPILYHALGVSASTCTEDSGNYYCSQTEFVQFEDVGPSSGSYDRVTSFNSDGTCSSESYSISGSMSPFNEELSVHFRGPIQLEKFEVYSKSSNSKRRLEHRHADPDPVYVYVSETYFETVYATAAATTVGAESSAAAAPSTTTSPDYAASSSTTYSEAVATNNYNYNHLDQSSATGSSVITESSTTSSSSSTSSSSAASSTSTSSSGAWSQVASYDASAGSADGLVFLNNLGGSGSGVFDYTWGNSLSYAASDGVSCASSPETLEQTTVPSNHEFIIFSSDYCEGDDCGYYRPGTVPYHGFGGDNKVFLFEFTMPTDDSASYNNDMPAVWMLNAQIPRTLQYGAESCSCWSTGCGELDLWEVLNTGNDKMLATLHAFSNGQGGSSNYFDRPVSDTFYGAVVFEGSTISVLQLDSFPDTVDDSTISSWTSGSASTVTI